MYRLSENYFNRRGTFYFRNIRGQKIEYDTAVKDLQKLLDKSDAQRKDTLWKAILKSEKTYDEILSYIESGDGVADE